MCVNVRVKQVVHTHTHTLEFTRIKKKEANASKVHDDDDVEEGEGAAKTERINDGPYRESCLYGPMLDAQFSLAVRVAVGRFIFLAKNENMIFAFGTHTRRQTL